MKILLFPIGGLANRMRAIDSAVNLSKTTKSDLQIYWIKDEGLNCNFNSIWKPIPCLRDVKGHLPVFLFYLYRRFSFIKSLLKILEKLKILKIFVDEFIGKDENIYSYVKKDSEKFQFIFLVIRTCEGFYPSHDFQIELFQLRPEIEKLVKNEIQQFDKLTIGVHIRRKDNIDSIENSPLELFEEQMEIELEEYPGTKFYIASDDEITKNYFKKSLKWKDKVILSQGSLSRKSQEGIFQAVIEFYSLTRTKKIFGSFYSSFSEIAASFGKIKLEVINKDSCLYRSQN